MKRSKARRRAPVATPPAADPLPRGICDATGEATVRSTVVHRTDVGDRSRETIVDLFNGQPMSMPAFLLKAKDVCAPDAIRAWALAASRMGAPAAKIGDAMLDAVAFEAWQREHGCKVPD